MNDRFPTPLPAAHTVAAFNARMIELIKLAMSEAAIDAEISADHGLELDSDLAEECLEESDALAAVRDPELRIAYRRAYVSFFVGS